jgi:nudix-type nucleoside diphosphatase (YffH/AdpP family)
VAGVIDAGETPETCARRECLEESGFKINRLEKVATVFSTPGITTERIHIFLGISTSKDQLHAGGGLEEEHEDIQLLFLSRDEAARMLKEQHLEDAKTILALQYFLLNY